MAKTNSKTTSVGRTSQTNKSYTKNKQTQSNKTKTYNNTIGKQTEEASGGQSSVSYKDLSNLSPATLALQNKVYNQTDYTPSDAVQNAYGKKTNAENALAGYGPYNSKYQESLDSVLNKIMNRQPFSYDFNADALYKTYADQYAQQGRQASENAAAAASALTGGYGNSYSASVANQAYEQYMTELNNRIPELYQMAADRYDKENNNMINQFNMLGSQEDRDYNRYNTERQNLVSDRDYYASDYSSERANDRQIWQDAYNNAMALLNYRTNLETRDVTDSTNWSKSEQESSSVTKGNETNKSKNVQTSSSKDNSVQNTSSTSYTNSSSGGSNSKATSGKKSTSVKTSSSDYNAIKSKFKEMVDDSRDKNGNTDQTKYHDAWYYLQDQVDAGYIKEDDMKKIATTLNEWNKRPK